MLDNLNWQWLAQHALWTTMWSYCRVTVSDVTDELACSTKLVLFLKMI